MATIMKRFTKGVVLKGETTDVTENAEGSLFQNSAELRLKAYIEGAVRQIVTNTQSQVLTNKTIDADNNSVSNIQTSNLKAGVLNTSTTLSGATNTQIPSALAVQTYVDAKAAAQNEASEISFTPAGTIAATTVQAMGQELDGDIQGHITDTTDAHAASAITNTPLGNLAATTVQGALDELQTDVDSRATTTALTNHTTASANVHGLAVGSSVVGTTDSQVLTNKTITGADIRTPIRSDVKQDTKANLTTYALTAANGQLVFATDTKEMFQVVDGTLKAVGGGGGVSDVDSLLIQPFDTSALTDFTQTGLELIETNPLDGTKSARLVHQAASTRSFKQTVAVPPKFRGVNMTASLTIRSSASQGNVTIVFRDETNAVDYPSQQLQTNSQAIASLVTNATTTVSGFSNSSINTLRVGMSVTGSGIPTGTTIASINTTALTITLSQAATASATVTLRFSDLPRTLQLGFTIPANCSSYSYTISALQESGSPETYIDDVVLKNYWLGMSNQGQSTATLEIPIETDWQPANFSTLAWQGLGTVTNNLQYKRQGSDLLIRGRVGLGTVSASEARIPLPLWNGSQLTIANSSKVPTINMGGRLIRELGSANNNKDQVALINAGFQYLTIGVNEWGTGAAPQTPQSGAGIFSTSDSIQFENVRIPIEGWAVTETKSFVTTDLVPAKAVFGNASLDIPNMTAWQGYTPTFQGFGTPTNVEFEWRQVGEDVEVRGKFTSGLATAVEARIGLPAGLNSAGTSIIPSLQQIGTGSFSGVTAGQSFAILQEPSVSYMTIGGNTGGLSALSKSNGNSYFSTGTILSFFAKVPCAGLSAVSTKTIGTTQSGIVQSADSVVALDGGNGWGSTATRTRRFSTIIQNIGSDVTYSDSAVNGSTFTIVNSGIYSISYSDSFAGAVDMAITKNSSNPAGAPSSLVTTQVLAISSTATASYVETTSWTGYLSAGDIIRAQSSSASAGVAYGVKFTITKQGSLTQLAVNSNQKATIPTSELRFEGASSRGSTATAIVRFDSIAKIRGDAFSIVSDAVNGTAITMLKAGKLDISASYLTSGSLRISKNQQTLTAAPIASESMASDYGTGEFANASYSGTVAVGDIFRISADANPTANAGNSLNLSFQEQDIQVSVSNTLPQFSESDTHVRVSGFGGRGSTNTEVVYFSSVASNTGSAVTYNPSATLGDSWTVNESGLYNITFEGSSNTSSDAGGFMIMKNATTSLGPTSLNTLAISYDRTNTVTTNQRYLTATAAGVLLVQGDVVRAISPATAANFNDGAQFTISKVGKPNVTGVNVTPFINVPQSDVEYIRTTGHSSFNGIYSISSTVVNNTNKGILSYSSSTGLFTAQKSCTINVAYSNIQGTAGADSEIYLNGVSVSRTDVGGTGTGIAQSWTGVLQKGDFIGFAPQFAPSNQNISITAEAQSDQILTAPTTFSTDTAALQYSSTYTLTTLSDAPVGTYITFTYAANTNTRTQTSTRPTQTDADMNANGILVYTRAYNAASTAAQPAVIAIQIGKGLKGLNLSGYSSTAKTNGVNLDYFISGSVSLGARIKSYNESTGILYLDAAYNSSSITSAAWGEAADLSNPSSAYIVINASRSPALTGVPLLQPRIATISDVKASGTAGGTATAGAYQTRTLNTLEDPTGIVSSLTSNQFTLPAGEYYIEFSAPVYSGVNNTLTSHKAKIRNITDSTDAILGSSEYNERIASGSALTNRSIGSGRIAVSSSKTFELQHRVAVTYATVGFGVNASFGDNEVYANIKITKIK